MKMYYVDEDETLIGDSEDLPDFSIWKTEYTSEVYNDGILTKVLMRCRKFTEAELSYIQQQKEEEENKELISYLPNAVADLSSSVSENSMTASDISDAIADLSAIVSDLSTQVISNG